MDITVPITVVTFFCTEDRLDPEKWPGVWGPWYARAFPTGAPGGYGYDRLSTAAYGTTVDEAKEDAIAQLQRKFNDIFDIHREHVAVTLETIVISIPVAP